MKTNFIIYLIRPGISICPERNLNPLYFSMHLRKYHHPSLPSLQSHAKIKKKKKTKEISVNLALDLIKETSFFNKSCTNPWKFYGVKKNNDKNMA